MSDYSLRLEKRVLKFIKQLPPKHQRQIKGHILNLASVLRPHDSADLIGYSSYRRTDCGEYRIIYRINEQTMEVLIVVAGRRNDRDVYNQFKRFLS